MSDNHHENSLTGTIKPVANKTSLRYGRPQTEGYQKDEALEQMAVASTTASAQPEKKALSTKPCLNLSASAYIPKSLGQNSATPSGAAAPQTNQPTATADKASAPALNQSQPGAGMLSANTQAYTPKMGSYPNMGMANTMNPMPAGYNMGASKLNTI